jgi:tetratricopeptide (TPR) repeat protein
MADVLRLLGRYGEAEEAYREALAQFGRLPADRHQQPEHRRAVAESHNFLGEVLRLTGRPGPAQTAYEEALAQQKQLAGDDPDEPAYRQDEARTRYNLGILLRQTGQPREARAFLEQSLRTLTALPDTEPNRQHRARVYLNLGTVFHDLREHTTAEEQHHLAIGLLSALAAKRPDKPDYRHELAAVHNNLGNLYGDRQLTSRRGGA